MNMQNEKRPLRLDAYLAKKGYYDSRARARDAIRRGCIMIDGKRLEKPGLLISSPGSVVIDDPARAYVSRAALKLVAGLEATGFDPSGCIAADLGASTGGFTQVLLERGARHVYAIDVGHRQLAPLIRDNPNVTNLESVNIRDLTGDVLDWNAPSFLTADLSFISLKLALPPALDLAAPGANGIFLVKPQFEVGRENLGRGGIVRDEAIQLRVSKELNDWLNTVPGWRSVSLIPSPISGGDGNREFLLAGVKDG